MIERYLRNTFRKILTKEDKLELNNNVPSLSVLKQKFRNINESGLYLHIPFCNQICPYCPYNKEIYKPDVAEKYTLAVKKEIDFYVEIIGDKPITSFYIGGGTPTMMLHNGLADIITYIFHRFNMQCGIHMESHPNHLSEENLDIIQSMGVEYISAGIESLQDRHLHRLGRPYKSDDVKKIISRVVDREFKCVNVDLMFALPGQTYQEIEQAGNALCELGVDQIAAYPIFRFPYTKMGSNGVESVFNLPTIIKRRKMLRVLEKIFYNAGFERSSVWAFTRKGVEKYCSVTVPLYIGLGASGGSYLKDIFYLNTFNAGEYIKALLSGKPAFALSLDLSERMQMAGWLYWRIYETKFSKKDFYLRFHREFDNVYGKFLKPMKTIGFLQDDGQDIMLSDRGTFWLHAFEDMFSIDYISTLWGTSKHEPWPKKVVL